MAVAGLFVAGCGSDDPAPTSEGCPPVDGADTQTQQFDAAPPDCLTPGATYEAIVTTNKGEFTITLDAESAPAAANNFVFLARNKYFDDTPCHRIIPNFVVQCGDPTGTGTGGPGYTIVDEPPEPGQYQVGSIAMAKTVEPDSAGSQFFIITGADGAALPPEYALFGQVTDGTRVDRRGDGGRRHAGRGNPVRTDRHPVDPHRRILIPVTWHRVFGVRCQRCRGVEVSRCRGVGQVSRCQVSRCSSRVSSSTSSMAMVIRRREARLSV